MDTQAFLVVSVMDPPSTLLAHDCQAYDLESPRERLIDGAEGDDRVRGRGTDHAHGGRVAPGEVTATGRGVVFDCSWLA